MLRRRQRARLAEGVHRLRGQLAVLDDEAHVACRERRAEHAADLVARLRNLTVTATKLVAAVDDISSAPRLGDAYETSARLAAGPARVCYTHRMRACAWDAWPTPLV